MLTLSYLLIGTLIWLNANLLLLKKLSSLTKCSATSNKISCARTPMVKLPIFQVTPIEQIAFIKKVERVQY